MAGCYSWAKLFQYDILTIELVLDGKRVMGTQWGFVEKCGTDGKVIKFKARYEAKGYAQIAKIEFFLPHGTFCLSLTPPHRSSRMKLANLLV